MGKASEAGGAKHHITCCKMQSHPARTERPGKVSGDQTKPSVGDFYFYLKAIEAIKGT